MCIRDRAAPERTAEEAAAHPLILVVHASVGSGHRSAANAIAEALEEAGEAARAAGDDNSLEARSEVRVLDILDFGRIVFDGDKTASMFTGWTRPFYDLTWRYTLTGRLLWGGGTIWARLMYPKFTEYVRRPVSYTHLDVYKRQPWIRTGAPAPPRPSRRS